ncbi:hypothetical protein F4779DRAFT_637376 [Xylariaceae sp. FL0662B]|nr:hypothetical protein F4779DRAFT_637376 [Xylariaceae sp. FL0662B]
MSSVMESPREFPRFMQLPPELRDMVWDFHDENLKRGIRHYFGAMGTRDVYARHYDNKKKRWFEQGSKPWYLRFYACIDIYKGLTIDSFSTRKAPAKTKSLTKIKLAGDFHSHAIGTRIPAKDLFGTLKFSEGSRHNPYINVDFQNHLFIFGFNLNFARPIEAILKSLAIPINSTGQLGSYRSTHWIRQIRKVGLRMNTRYNWGSYKDDLHPHDMHTLPKFESVEVVYLIIPLPNGPLSLCNYKNAYAAVRDFFDDEGFLPVSQLDRLYQAHLPDCHPFHDVEPVSDEDDDDYEPIVPWDAKQHAAQFEPIFEKIKSAILNARDASLPDIEFKMVVDPCEIFGLRAANSPDDQQGAVENQQVAVENHEDAPDNQEDCSDDQEEDDLENEEESFEEEDDLEDD